MRTIILSLLLVGGTALPSISQANPWTKEASFPGVKRIYPITFSIGTKGYLGTGSNSNFTTIYSDLWEWDQATNTWSQKASLPSSAKRVGSVSFAIGAKGYVGTGYDGGLMSDFWEWDQATNTWTQKADFPGGGRYDAIAFSIGNKGYIGTGSGPYNDFWEWDQATDTWTRKADLPAAGRLGGVGFSIGTKGYTGAGTASNFTIFFKDFWEWDQTTDSWTQKADFAGGPRYYGVGFSTGATAYVGTGINNSKAFSKDLWKWDQATNTWTKEADFPGGARAYEGGTGSFVIGTKGYFGTGVDGSGNLYNDFWEYQTDASAGVSKPDETRDEIGIYPNPFSTSATVTIPQRDRSIAGLILKIFDYSGKEVKSYTVKNTQIEIPASDLRVSGSYIIRLLKGSQIVDTGKLILRQ